MIYYFIPSLVLIIQIALHLKIEQKGQCSSNSVKRSSLSGLGSSRNVLVLTDLYQRCCYTSITMMTRIRLHLLDLLALTVTKTAFYFGICINITIYDQYKAI